MLGIPIMFSYYGLCAEPAHVGHGIPINISFLVYSHGAQLHIFRKSGVISAHRSEPRLGRNNLLLGFRLEPQCGF